MDNHYRFLFIYSGNVFEIVNTKDRYSRKTYEKSVYRFDANSNKNEFVFLSLGDSMELHYREIEPSMSDFIYVIKSLLILN